MIQHKSHPKDSTLIIILFFLSAISSIASDMYIAALPHMGYYFNASVAEMKWTLSLFFIGLSCSQLVYGPLSDYMGRKKVMMLGFIVFLLGCLFCLISRTFYLFLVGRFIQGCGVGSAACLSRAIMRDAFEGPMLAKALSIVGMGISIVPAAAPILGSYIQYLIGWKFEFAFMMFYAITLQIIARLIIPETNTYIGKNKNSIKKIIKDYQTTLIDRKFLINVLIASFTVSMIYIFYTITSFYLQNQYHWSSTQYSRITIIISSSLFLKLKIG